MAKRIHRELPFSHWLKNERLLEGVIDLLFEEEGGFVVVDYKTDRIASDNRQALVEVYTPQLQSYAKTIAELTGLNALESCLYFVRTQECIDVLQGDSQRPVV